MRTKLLAVWSVKCKIKVNLYFVGHVVGPQSPSTQPQPQKSLWRAFKNVVARFFVYFCAHEQQRDAKC